MWDQCAILLWLGLTPSLIGVNRVDCMMKGPLHDRTRISPEITCGVRQTTAGNQLCLRWSDKDFFSYSKSLISTISSIPLNHLSTNVDPCEAPSVRVLQSRLWRYIHFRHASGNATVRWAVFRDLMSVSRDVYIPLFWIEAVARVEARLCMKSRLSRMVFQVSALCVEVDCLEVPCPSLGPALHRPPDSVGAPRVPQHWAQSDAKTLGLNNWEQVERVRRKEATAYQAQ